MKLKSMGEGGGGSSPLPDTFQYTRIFHWQVVLMSHKLNEDVSITMFTVNSSSSFFDNYMSFRAGKMARHQIKWTGDKWDKITQT